MHQRTWESKRAAVVGYVAFMLVAGAGCTDSGTGPNDGADGGPNQDGNAGVLDGGTPGGGDRGDGGIVDEDGGVHEGLAVEGDRRVPFTPTNDRAFAKFFLAHHQMAVQMAEHVADNGADADIKAMAVRVVEAQTKEIEILQDAITGLGDTEAPPAMPPDPHGEAEMEHMMTLSGPELDEMFLIDMIAHHASALPSAHRALMHLKRADLKTLAQKMFEDQAREIGEMRAKLAAMGVESAGEDMAEDGPGRSDFGLEGDRRIPMTPGDDIAFIDFFVPHHEMAIKMAEAEVERGGDMEIKNMASMMLSAQMAEVETMREARMKLAGEAKSPPMPPDPHAAPEMAAMEKMSGEELDRMFLMEMIPHHASALPTAHRAVPHVMEPELRALATSMYNAQAEEIGRMREMLDNTGN